MSETQDEMPRDLEWEETLEKFYEFYAVYDEKSLIEEMGRHIQRLQDKLQYFRPIRRGRVEKPRG